MVNLAPKFSRELILATQAINRLMNAPLKKPINTMTARIMPWLVDRVHMTATNMINMIVNPVTTLKTLKMSVIIPGMIRPNTDTALNIDIR